MKRHIWFASLAATVLLVGQSSSSVAQTVESPWSVEVAGGIVFPTGAYANTANPGFGLAGTLGYTVNRNWTVLGNFNAGFLKGETGPDWNLYSYFLKLAYDTGESSAKWRILIPLGAGGVTFAPDSDASSKTYFALNSGLMFQYYLSPKLALAFDGLATLVFSTNDLGSDTIWLFPLSAGLLFRF